jgi:hypothetical protein
VNGFVTGPFHTRSTSNVTAEEPTSVAVPLKMASAYRATVLTERRTQSAFALCGNAPATIATRRATLIMVSEKGILHV